MNKIKTPTIVVVFGATGDLSQTKLIPALMDLSAKNLLPDILRVVGFSRRKWNDIEYKKFARSSIKQKKHKHDQRVIDGFLENILYKQGDFTDQKYYKELSAILKGIDLQIGQCSNKLFYLAVPPNYYEVILKNLSKSGLTKPCSSSLGWTRVLVEKPFGKNNTTAQKLDKLLTKLFREEQIFRIDHYLAKETLQNILSFRFSNSIFEPIWNNKYIESIKIRLLEKSDLKARANFYDGIGALRDVGQNHLLQMLALITMENPGEISAKTIRANREKIFSCLILPLKKEIKNVFIRAQYKGYKKEKGVSVKTQTETYFSLKTFVNNQRWKGVPIILESGKALSKNKVDISVEFKAAMPCFCEPNSKKAGLTHNHKNQVIFNIQPEELITVRFWAKEPGMDFKIAPRDLSFNYKENIKKELDAYEKVLYDCIIGDQTLFVASGEVMNAWKFIDSVVKAWKDVKLIEYKKGALKI